MKASADASASLRLALQKIDRARESIRARNTGTALLELHLAVNAIEDAQSVLTPGDTPEAGPS